MIEATNSLASKLALESDKDEKTLLKASAICGLAERLRFTFTENPDLIEDLKVIYRHDLSAKEHVLVDGLIQIVHAAHNLQDVFELWDCTVQVQSAKRV